MVRYIPVIDVGNTSAKLAWIRLECDFTAQVSWIHRISTCQSSDTLDPKTLITTLLEAFEAGKKVLYNLSSQEGTPSTYSLHHNIQIVCVNSTWSTALEALQLTQQNTFKPYRFTLHTVNTLLEHYPCDLSDYPVTRLGKDRFLAGLIPLYTARSGRLLSEDTAHENNPTVWLILSAGTAITLDVWVIPASHMPERRKFLGGLILPGLRLLGTALSHQIPTLPTITAKDLLLTYNTTLPKQTLGHDTLSCITQGLQHLVYGGLILALQTILQGLKPQENLPLATVSPVLLITGGDGEVLYQGLQQHAHLLPSNAFSSWVLAPHALLHQLAHLATLEDSTL
ncbi:MAG: type III pantothenate kinase [Vampirovibrionales bacterium]